MQLPTPASLCAQIVLSVIVGVCFAFTSVLPLDYNASLSTISLPCITSSVLQLLFTTIYGTNHEINPKQYQSHHFRKQANIIKSMSTIVPICYAVLAIYVHFQSLIDWSDYIVYFICVPPAIVFYLHVFDYALRILICSTPSNLRKIVEEASGGDASVEIFIDVILRSLLHSNDDLVKKLGKNPSKSSIWMNLEEEELKLNDAAVKTMAKSLLQKTSQDEASPRLEDDILRLAILSYIGGSASKEDGTFGNKMANNLYHRLMSISNDTTTEGSCIDPYAVAIVRALCVYIGGFGEALQLISNSETRIFDEAWVLPPGALFACECAFRGASHWIIQSMCLPRSKTGVAILVPVLLNAAYRLTQGLLQYQKASKFYVSAYQPHIESDNNIKQWLTTGSASSDKINDSKLFRTTSPQLWPLYNICDDCIRTILETAKSSEGFCRLSFLESLDIDCQRWLESKIST